MGYFGKISRKVLISLTNRIPRTLGKKTEFGVFFELLAFLYNIYDIMLDVFRITCYILYTI